MKKILLASSALVGASLLAAPVQAGTVGSGDNMSVTISGIYWFQVNFTDEDISAGHGRGYKFKAPESEVNVVAKNTADNGITYGVTIELEAGTDTAGADEAYATLESDAWGLVQMGDNDSVGNQMHIGSFQTNKSGSGTLGGLTNLSPAFHNQFNAFLVRTDYDVATTSDATKINYFTPRFAGFQLGASLTPDTGSNGLSATETDNDGDFENVVDLGVNYVGKFDDIGISLGAFGQWGDDESASGSAVGQEDLSVWGVGAKVDFAGFSVGADYRDNGDSTLTAAQTAAGGDMGTWWSVGVGYSMGPWGIDAHYALGERDVTAAVENSIERIGIGAGYTVAPGWRVTADLEMIEEENRGGVVTVDQDSKALMFTNFFSF